MLRQYFRRTSPHRADGSGHPHLRQLRGFFHILVTIYIVALTFLALTTRPAVNTSDQTATPECASGQFITTDGATLCAHGRALRLIGYNWHWVGTGCSAPSDANIERIFAEIERSSKANTVRTAFFQSGSNGGTYEDFNRYIAAAKRHNLYIVPILANQWTSCEPSSAPKSAPWYQQGYKSAGDGYPLAFRDYVRNLAAYYADEPTIAFWQLVNEPDALGADCGAMAAHIVRAFADDMASVIKSVDRHHLVDLGVPGSCAADNRADYMTIVAGSVDVADVWHDYQDATTAVPEEMQERMRVLQVLEKPAFVGESGICADVRRNGECAGAVSQTTLEQRATFFETKLAAGFRSGISGYLIWNRGSHSHAYDVGQSDPTEKALARYALNT